jgi:hypothetical protein
VKPHRTSIWRIQSKTLHVPWSEMSLRIQPRNWRICTEPNCGISSKAESEHHAIVASVRGGLLDCNPISARSSSICRSNASALARHRSRDRRKLRTSVRNALIRSCNVLLRLPEISALLKESHKHPLRTAVLRALLVVQICTCHGAHLHPRDGTPSHNRNRFPDFGKPDDPVKTDSFHQPNPILCPHYSFRPLMLAPLPMIMLFSYFQR